MFCDKTENFHFTRLCRGISVNNLENLIVMAIQKKLQIKKNKMSLLVFRLSLIKNAKT